MKVKLDAFERYELSDINAVADKYTKLFGDIVTLPVVPEGFYSSWAQYTLQLENKEKRDELQKRLKESGIPSMVYYPKPMHEQTAFAGVKKYVDCPVTVRLCDTVLSVPMHPYLTDEEIQKVVSEVKKYLS